MLSGYLYWVECDYFVVWVGLLWVVLGGVVGVVVFLFLWLIW